MIRTNHTNTQVRVPDQPWPKPLSPSELAHWLDVLGNYTEEAPAPAKKGSAPPKGMYVCIGCNVPAVGCIVPANVDPPTTPTINQ